MSDIKSDVVGMKVEASVIGDETGKEAVKALHGFWRPRETKKMAKAEAYRIREVGKAENEMRLLDCETDLKIKAMQEEFSQRATERLKSTDLYDQKNLDIIVEKTIKNYLPSHVQSENVSPDWARKYIEKAKMVSDPEVQDMWSRILAGEIANPGSFSYRTLSILENMTKHEANAFIALCQFCYYGKILFYDTKYFNDNLNLSYNSVLLLQSIGLINYDFFLHLYYDLNKESSDAVIEFDNYAYVCRSQEPREISIGPIIALTQEGVQISSLIKKEMPKAYFEYVLQKIKKIYPMVEIYKAPVIQSSETYSEFDLEKIERI